MYNSCISHIFRVWTSVLARSVIIIIIMTITLTYITCFCFVSFQKCFIWNVIDIFFSYFFHSWFNNTSFKSISVSVSSDIFLHIFKTTSLSVLEHQVPPCPAAADEFDIPHALLKALESDGDSPPWPSLPSLHLNIDNKVRHIPDPLPSHFSHIMRRCPAVVFTFLLLPSVRPRRSSSPKSLCTRLSLLHFSLITLNATSWKPRWRQPSGWVDYTHC